MIKSIARAVIGATSIIGYFLNTIFWFIPIFLLSFFKLIPIKQLQSFFSYILDGCASAWIAVNNLNQKLFSSTLWQVEGTARLKSQDWYLVISNHQSWVDILVLQRIFGHKIPFLKFFLKRELIWIPFLGLAWWALDFPFMRRYSRAFLAKHPHLKGKDLASTQKACEKFQFKPVSVMNFVEGTRWTKQKHQSQSSPYEHLLKPKAGGLAFVLSSMGSHLNQLLDVTIYYPDGAPTFWDFVCGKVKNIKVKVNQVEIATLFETGVFAKDYFDNPEQKEKFQAWLNQLWQQKDNQLKELSTS